MKSHSRTSFIASLFALLFVLANSNTNALHMPATQQSKRYGISNCDKPNDTVINLCKQETRDDLPTTDPSNKPKTTVFAILNTTNRTLLDSEITPPECGPQKGRSYIVVRILINPNGDVLNALAGINDGNSKTKNASQCLIDWAKAEALTLKFSEIDGNKSQSGIIVFDIREK